MARCLRTAARGQEMTLQVAAAAAAVQAAAVAYLTPFFGVIFSWLLIGDRLGVTEIFGGLLVVAGVAVLSTDRR